MSGFLSDAIRRWIDHDPGDAPAVDLGLDLLEDDYVWVDSGSGPGWSPPKPPLMRTRDLIHPA